MKATSDAEKELDSFKRKQDREKQRLVDEMDNEK